MLRTDGRLIRGERSRSAILDTAVALATEAGLDGLSLGQLAQRLGVSKSGLFAHWSSKEELQLATIERAREQFIARVVSPALRAPGGVRRLWALHESRMGYVVSVELPGGCFFTNTQFEFTARTGAVRDRLADALAEWIGLIESLAAQAIQAGELAPETDARQLAFEINAVGVACVYQSRLLPADEVLAQTRAAVLNRLRALCPDPNLLPEA